MRLYLSSFRCGSAPGVLRELAGGNRRTALIANADDGKEAGLRESSTAEELGRLTDIGLDPVELDLREYFGSSASRIASDLRRFGIVWARGGSAFVLRRALRQSGADQCLPGLIEQDAFVYAGYSAGVVILGPTLRGLEEMEDPLRAPAGYDADPLWDGLSILPYSLVPHYRSPHPSSEGAERAVACLLVNRLPVRTMVDGDVLVVDRAGERFLC